MKKQGYNNMKNKILMSSWDLKEKLSCLKTPLYDLIMEYIEKNEDSCTGRIASFSNYIYRSNLQYILENHEEKFDEIKTFLERN